MKVDEDSSYDATSTENPDNVTALANFVKNDLNASDTETGVKKGFYVATDTSNPEKPVIEITYKDPKITIGTIANLKPRTNGQVLYKIKLQNQNAILETEETIIIGINYGTKTAGTIDVGDDLTIGNESFRVLSKTATQIVAVPHYNITLDTSNPVQSTSSGTTKFTAQQTDKYWANGQDDIDWTNDKCLLKPYVQAYSNKLNVATGSTGKVSARLGKRSEFIDNAIELPTGSTITKNQVRNPGQTNSIWLCSGNTNRGDFVDFVESDGRISGGIYSYSTCGVRPVLVIDLS